MKTLNLLFPVIFSIMPCVTGCAGGLGQAVQSKDIPFTEFQSEYSRPIIIVADSKKHVATTLRGAALSAKRSWYQHNTKCKSSLSEKTFPCDYENGFGIGVRAFKFIDEKNNSFLHGGEASFDLTGTLFWRLDSIVSGLLSFTRYEGTDISTESRDWIFTGARLGFGFRLFDSKETVVRIVGQVSESSSREKFEDADKKLLLQEPSVALTYRIYD